MNLGQEPKILTCHRVWAGIRLYYQCVAILRRERLQRGS